MVTFTYTLKEICSLLNISETASRKIVTQILKLQWSQNFSYYSMEEKTVVLDWRHPCLHLLSSRLFLGLSEEKGEVKEKKIRIILVDTAGLTVLAEMDDEAGWDLSQELSGRPRLGLVSFILRECCYQFFVQYVLFI